METLSGERILRKKRDNAKLLPCRTRERGKWVPKHSAARPLPLYHPQPPCHSSLLQVSIHFAITSLLQLPVLPSTFSVLSYSAAASPPRYHSIPQTTFLLHLLHISPSSCPVLISALPHLHPPFAPFSTLFPPPHPHPLLPVHRNTTSLLTTLQVCQSVIFNFGQHVMELIFAADTTCTDAPLRHADRNWTEA